MEARYGIPVGLFQAAVERSGGSALHAVADPERTRLRLDPTDGAWPQLGEGLGAFLDRALGAAGKGTVALVLGAGTTARACELLAQPDARVGEVAGVDPELILRVVRATRHWPSPVQVRQG